MEKEKRKNTKKERNTTKEKKTIKEKETPIESQRKKQSSRKKTLKVLRIIALLCLLVLLAEGIYLLFLHFSREAKRIYTSVSSTFIEDKDNFYVVGSSDFKKSKVGYQDGLQKARFAKYNKDGKLLVEKAYLKGYNSIYNDICKVQGGFIAVGQYEKTEQDQKEATGTGIIVKYDENGKVLYQKEVLVLEDTVFKKVKPLSDGGYIVVGQTIFENMTLGFDDRGGGLMIRYDKEGKEVWRANFGGSKSGTFNDILIDEKNNAIYVVGKDATRTGLLVKYNLDGKRLFVKNYSSTDTVGFSSVAKLDDDLVIVGSKKLSEDKEDYHTACLLLKYDKDGHLLWEKTYQKNEMGRFNQLLIQEDKIYVVGHSAVLNEEKTTKALRVFDYTGLFASFDKNGKILASNQFKTKNTETYFSSLIKAKQGFYLTGQSNNKSLSNGKDMHAFIIEVDQKGKLKEKIA